MPQSRRTRMAEKDLLGIWTYLATTAGLNIADIQVAKVESEFTFLAANPKAGPTRFDLRPRLRSWPVGNYIVFYRPLKSGVEVLRVIHGARDLSNIFGRRN